MRKNILITGGTGLVGTRLSEKLLSKGYSVSFLSRKAGEGKIKKYRWDIAAKHIDEEAIAQADAIIHLAGAGVFDGKWTEAYRKEIISSRVDTTLLLGEKITTVPNQIKTVLCASGIGIYGADTGDVWLDETSGTGDGFLAEVTTQWEASTAVFEKRNIRTVRMRIGIVLSNKGGALTELSGPIRYYIGSPMGSGKQYVSWIHIDDLCDMFIYALENETLKGAYNAAAPDPITNAVLTKEIALALKKPLWAPNIPAFVLNFILGSEKAAVLLGGNRVSAKKITETGFRFTYTDIKTALSDLLPSNK